MFSAASANLAGHSTVNMTLNIESIRSLHHFIVQDAVLVID
jgi:hypothetical protein